MRRKYPAHPIIAVGATVVHEGRLLFVRRGSEPNKDKWTVPGGIVELCEKVRDAVIRETREECGLEIEIADERPMDVLDNIIVDRNGKPEYHYVVLHFLSQLRGRQLRPGTDVKEASWVPLQEVENYDLTRAFRAFYERFSHSLSRAC